MAIINPPPGIKIVNTPTQEYMVLIRGGERLDNASPEEIRKILGKFQAWYEKLSATGKVKGGHPLVRRGEDPLAEKRPDCGRPFRGIEGNHRRILPVDGEQPRGSGCRSQRVPRSGTRSYDRSAASCGRMSDDGTRETNSFGTRTRTRRGLGSLISKSGHTPIIMDQNVSSPGTVSQMVEHLFRHEAAKMVATLTRIFGLEHLTLAEDVVQATLARALQTWPFYGVPKNPAAWIMRASRNAALDVVRREKVFRGIAPGSLASNSCVVRMAWAKVGPFR